MDLPLTDRAPPRLALLRRLALACAVLVLAITSLSAYIRLSKTGPPCLDAPHCQAQLARPAPAGEAAAVDEAGGVRVARLLHRVTAVAVLGLALVMVMICFDPRSGLRRERWDSLGLLALVIFLAVLGRWSATVRVPVVIGNLLGGFALLALAWRLALPRSGDAVNAPVLRAGAWVTAALLAGDVALGGATSASRAATAPPDAWAAVAGFAHSLLGLAAALLVVLLGTAALRRGWLELGGRLLVLPALACGLGLALSGSGGSLALALAHNVVAALLLASVVELTSRAGGQRAA